jgi:mono/diheme cytochrome c family protein
MKYRNPGILWILLALELGCRSESGGTSPPAAAKSAAITRTPSAELSTAPVSRVWSLPQPELGYNARQGRILFRHYCVTCHGVQGHGDGFNAYNLDPKPRDLADREFQGRRSDEELGAIIRSGGGVAGMSTGMPPWGRTLNERAIHNLVVYLRNLPTTAE